MKYLEVDRAKDPKVLINDNNEIINAESNKKNTLRRMEDDI